MERVGDLTAPVVGQIKDAIRRKLAQAQEIALQLEQGANRVIDDVTGQPRVATEGAGNASPSQIRTDGASRTTTSGSRRSADGRGTTTAGRVISPLVGKDFNNLTSTELAQFNRDYVEITRDGLPSIIRRKPGRVEQGVPQIHLEEVDGKQIIRDGPASSAARLSNKSTMDANYTRANGAIPDGHQIHHIVPDEIVRQNELARTAYDRGIFDLDRATNLQGFPSQGQAGEIVHRGSHTNWSNYVKGVLEDERDRLIQKYGVAELKDIPEATLDRELRDIFNKLEDELREDLNDIPLGLQEGWLKPDPNGSGGYRISENEEQNTQVAVA